MPIVAEKRKRARHPLKPMVAACITAVAIMALTTAVAVRCRMRNSDGDVCRATPLARESTTDLTMARGDANMAPTDETGRRIAAEDASHGLPRKAKARMESRAPVVSQTRHEAVQVASCDASDSAESCARPGDLFVKSATDQLIVIAMGAADTAERMPPLPSMHSPDGGNAEFLASLENEVEILDDDPPEIRRRKEYLITVRAQIREIIGAGGTFEDALQEYRDWINESAARRRDAIRTYRQLMRDDPDAAESYKAEVNEELEAEGIAPIGERAPAGRDESQGTGI